MAYETWCAGVREYRTSRVLFLRFLFAIIPWTGRQRSGRVGQLRSRASRVQWVCVGAGGFHSVTTLLGLSELPERHADPRMSRYVVRRTSHAGDARHGMAGPKHELTQDAHPRRPSPATPASRCTVAHGHRSKMHASAVPIVFALRS